MNFLGSLPVSFHRVRSSAAFALLLMLTACQTAPLNQFVLGPDYQPSNVYKQAAALPPTLRRIALLPLYHDDGQVDVVAANQSLEPVLETELQKTQKFELVRVSPDALRQWTGKKYWAADEKLPPNFFAILREQTGCEGVLFGRVSRFHPYPPLVVGWNLKLVAVADAQAVWAIDETFDASEPLVSNSARRYEQHHPTGVPATDTPMILNSPRRFGHYTVWAALGTLPPR